MLHHFSNNQSGPFFLLPMLCLNVLIGPVTLASAAPPQKIPQVGLSLSKELKRNPNISMLALSVAFLKAAECDTQVYQKQVLQLQQDFAEFVKTQTVTTANERLSAVQKFFFIRRGFTSDIRLDNLSNLYPDQILENRRGYCLGLCLLIAAVIEPQGWPIQIAAAPRHTFLRYTEAHSKLNFETTRAGAIVNDSWYQEQFGHGRSQFTIKLLTPSQIAAHLINNHGYAYLEKVAPSGQTSKITIEQQIVFLRVAESEFSNAIKLFPLLAEAHINQGVLAGRRQQFDKARRLFSKAMEIWNGDPQAQLNRLIAALAMNDLQMAVADATELLRQSQTPQGLQIALDSLRHQIFLKKQWSLLQQLSVAENKKTLRLNDEHKGLKAQYYTGKNFEQLTSKRIDKDLSFNWKGLSPGRGLPRNNFSVRWSGYLTLPVTDKYSFFVTCSDGVRLRVNGRLLIDSWITTSSNFEQAELQLIAGPHKIEIEYFEAHGSAGFLLMLARDGDEKMLKLPKLLSFAAEQ